MTASNKWSDLRTRLVSGVLLLAVGLFCLWWGGWALVLLAAAVAGTGVWELARMTGPGAALRPEVLGALAAALSLVAALAAGPAVAVAALAAVPLAGLAGPRRDLLVWLAYAFAIMLAVHGLVGLRAEIGLRFVLWLVLVVVASDVLGYFAGRILGGPKFWPRVSPKKTWSGTVAGWIGAALVGLAFARGQGGDAAGLVLLSVLTAFCAQMGDIAESAIKRRAGIKDSSALIPGHGGVLDRFDALIGALVFLAALRLAQVPLPGFGG